MIEIRKTVIFIGVALALGLVTVLARPKQETLTLPNIVGKPLFEKFSDPTKAADLEVVRYSENLGEMQTFEISKNAAGLWSIPSHGNYPADAQDQMKEAANSLIGLTVLDVASNDQSDHELYGVREPDKEKLKLGDKGVGLLVSFKDEKGDALGRLIVGHQVKNTTDQRFVRIPGQDAVYVVKINPDKLSTKFEDWIEKDLLKISTFDVERLRLKDYSVVPTTQGYGLQPRSEIAVAYDSGAAKWNLQELVTFKGATSQKMELLPGEELDKEKLDNLKNALGDIQIADVFPKPKGLGASLKATGDFAKDAEARRSLESRGFILNPENNELLSANGELHVLMKDGVEYLLRFGNVAGEEEGSEEGKLNRFLFVTARVDQSKFPEPQLEDLPPLPEGSSTATPAPADSKPADSKPADSKPADSKPADSKPADKPAEPALEAPATNKPADKPAEEKPADKPVEKPADKPAEEKPAGEGGCEEVQDPAADDSAKKSDEPPAINPPANPSAGDPEKPAGDAKPAAPDADAPPAAPKADAPLSEDELKRKKIEAERERITRDNQRKLDEWKDRKQKAEEKVAELNSRFADWYYVISEDVYKKLHLSRSDIIKESATAADEGTGIDAFEKLKSEGLKKTETPKP